MILYISKDKYTTKKEKKCIRIKRVKSDSYITYGQSCKTYMELYVDTPHPDIQIVNIVLR
jgi:hypothetical protein